MSFFDELKRRNVVKMTLLYAVASWLILQVADLSVSLLELPHWIGKTIFLLLALGFPFVLIFSWVYEMTPEGLRRETNIDSGQSIKPEIGHKMNVLIVVMLALAISGLIADRLMPETMVQKAKTNDGEAAVQPDIAAIYAYRSEPDDAFSWLNKAVTEKDPALSDIRDDKLFSNLHDDPRWPVFLERIGKSPSQLAAIEFDVTPPE